MDRNRGSRITTARLWIATVIVILLLFVVWKVIDYRMRPPPPPAEVGIKK